jgi:PAS domain S-box-containing protein
VRDREKTKPQLMHELEELLQRVADFESSEAEFKQVERALRHSEESFRDLYENAPIAYFSISAVDGSILRCNSRALRLLGYERETLMRMKVLDLYAATPHGESKAKEVFKRFKAGESIRDVELQMKHKDGRPIWISLSVEPLKDRDGNVTRSRSMVVDISGRKLAQEALRKARDELEQRVQERTAELATANKQLRLEIEERRLAGEGLVRSEAQKKAILDASIDRIRLVDRDMKIVWANKTMTGDPDISPEDLVGKFCYEIFSDRTAPCPDCPTKKALSSCQIERAVIHRGKSGSAKEDIYLDDIAVPIKNESGDIVNILQVARDITDQKLAEEHIFALSQQLMKAQEIERQRLSCDLHDNLAQDLSSIKIGLDTLFDDQPAGAAEKRQRASVLSEMIKRAIMDVRNLAYDLRPGDLDQLGLAQTVRRYCEEFSARSGLEIEFLSVGMDDLELDFDTEIALYRLIQEGLANIQKHADASKVTIRLVTSFPNIILRIEDNGKGFNVKKRLHEALEEKRMGLRSMQQRVALLNGKIEIKSHPGKGTKILVEVPYREKDSG